MKPNINIHYYPFLYVNMQDINNKIKNVPVIGGFGVGGGEESGEMKGTLEERRTKRRRKGGTASDDTTGGHRREKIRPKTRNEEN